MARLPRNLTTEAITVNADDYFVIDGETGGTKPRKILSKRFVLLDSGGAADVLISSDVHVNLGEAASEPTGHKFMNLRWDSTNGIFWIGPMTAGTGWDNLALVPYGGEVRFGSFTAGVRVNGKNVTVPQLSLSYSATTNIDLAAEAVQVLTLTGGVTFTTSNKAAGKAVQIIVSGGASARTVAFPSGWIWLGSASPTSLAASKTAVLSLYCKGTAESDVIAAWSVQA